MAPPTPTERALGAVVFDCDGLLLDTESRWTIAERATVERWNGVWDPGFKARLLGVAVPEAATIIAGHVGAGPSEVPAIAASLEQGFERALSDQGCEPMPGVVALMAALLHAGVPVAVASNTRLDLVDRAIAHSGLPRRFSAVVCAGNGRAPKPAPDVYLAACEALGVAPAAALALEDSQTGVDAARAAGIRVVGVPSATTPHLAADLVVDSLADLAVADLERVVRR